MNGQAYIILFAVLGLGLFGLWYVVLDQVMTTQVETFASTNIIDANHTAYQVLYGYVWDAVVVVVVLAFLIFVIVWSQRRRIEEI